MTHGLIKLLGTEKNKVREVACAPLLPSCGCKHGQKPEQNSTDRVHESVGLHVIVRLKLLKAWCNFMRCAKPSFSMQCGQGHPAMVVVRGHTHIIYMLYAYRHSSPFSLDIGYDSGLVHVCRRTYA